MSKNFDYSDWSKEDLINQIKNLEKRKKYGLVWDEEREPEEVVLQCKKELPVLKEVKSKEIKTDPAKPTHILIESDNYHALSTLCYTHEKRIDAIYIDPPYNTGNNSWKYNNKFVDLEDTFRHSKWISFMNRRLELSKNLIAEDGVICVTIDNYEIHNLRHLMEEIFRDREIIITVIEHNFRGRAKNNFALTHEYALWAVPKNKDIITKLTEFSDDIQRNLRRTGQGSRRYESPTMFYGIEVDKKSLKILSVTEPLEKDEKIPRHLNNKTEMIWPIDTDGVERRWYYGKTTVKDEIKKGEVWAKKIRDRIEIHYRKPGKLKRRKSVWSDPKYDSSTYGSELLTSIIGENDFPFPKSLYAVIECIKAMTNKRDAVVLDFFAGSGTVGHAILELNKIDGGNRQFIIITNNENEICKQITYPRISNVIKGYSFSGVEKTILFEKKLNLNLLRRCQEVYDEYSIKRNENENEYDELKGELKNNTLSLIGIKRSLEKKEGLKENLKYFRPAFISSKPTDQNKQKLTNQSVEMLCIKENTFELVKETETMKIYENNEKCTGILFDEQLIPEFKKLIKQLKKPASVYIFSLGDDDFIQEFEDMKNMVKVCSIPTAILRIYKRIFK